MAANPKIPAIPAINVADKNLQRILQAMKERIEKVPILEFYGHPIFIGKAKPDSNPTGQYLWLQVNADGTKGKVKLWWVDGREETLVLTAGG